MDQEIEISDIIQVVDDTLSGLFESAQRDVNSLTDAAPDAETRKELTQGLAQAYRDSSLEAIILLSAEAGHSFEEIHDIFDIDHETIANFYMAAVTDYKRESEDFSRLVAQSAKKLGLEPTNFVCVQDETGNFTPSDL
tara:strand:- start:1309 stop:1722 length:414 start_codon:yes stop_codon:yes gene_type:complete